MEAFAKGLAVIRAFDGSAGTLTLSEVAERAQLPAAGARRLLHTMVELGYARTVDKRFALTSKILGLGQAYLSSLSFRDVARSLIDDFARDTGEVCTVSVLEDSDVVYVVRAEVRTQLTRSVGVGGRLPAHATSSGLVLLADLDPAALDAYLAQAPFPAFTRKTRTEPAAIREAVAFVKENGWMLSSEELELGVCGLAVPVRNSTGKTVAALAVSINLARHTEDDIRDAFLSRLQDIAARMRHLA